jgi:hypothetical protein
MDLSPTSDQVELRSAFSALLTKKSSSDQVRASEPFGFDSELWDLLVDFGIPGLADTASLADLAVLTELCGEHLASAPIIESLVARRLLLRAGGDLPEGIITFCPRPAGSTVRLAPGGAVSAGVLVLRGDELIRTRPGAETNIPNRTLSGLALADVATDGATVLAHGDQARHWNAAALADWRTLTAAALAGIAARAVQLGVTYVKERHQFGQPVGAFQALQHQLADVATHADGARLIAHEAAWSIDQGQTRATGLAAAAFTFTAATAQSACATSLHAHGGYGYTMEYDIQLYFRRARALALLAGGNDSALGDVAALALAEVS